MQSSSIKVCIIPAAGRGSRWAPVSGYLPKEMLPLVDRPVIDWVIQEAVSSGCEEIVVVINSQKKIIKDYLLSDKILNKKAKIHFVYQEHPNGIAPALLLCEKYIKGLPFGVALPDLPTLSKKPVLSQLIGAFEKGKQQSHIISFNSFPTETLHHYTECLLELRKDKLFEIIHFCPKLSEGKSHHPGNRIRMSGRYVFDVQILEIIKRTFIQSESQEIKEFDALKEALSQGQKVLGLNIEGHTYDTGNPLSYVRANTAFFKKKLAKIR